MQAMTMWPTEVIEQLEPEVVQAPVELSEQDQMELLLLAEWWARSEGECELMLSQVN